MIETERLIIRPPTFTDANAMQAMKEANWEELQKWMSWTSDSQYDMDATIDFITQFAPNDRTKGGLILFAFHKGSGDLVMIGGLNSTDTPNVLSTGYWGNIQYLGHGYATEMTRSVIDFAFTHHGTEKLLIDYYEGNNASKRVIEKCGFQFVETLPKNHKSFATGEMMDEHRYAMTRNQWQRHRQP